MRILFAGISKGRGKIMLLKISATLFIISPGKKCGSIQLLKKQVQIKIEKKHAKRMQFQMRSEHESWFNREKSGKFSALLTET